MIIDFRQNKEYMEISYVDEQNNIEIIKAELPYGYYKYVECDDADNQKINELKSFKGSSIKREHTKYFSNLNINEYFNSDLKQNQPELYDLVVDSIHIPKCYSLDIETEINDEFGYSNAENAENKILSISITDESCNTLLFIVNNPNYRDFTNEDKLAIGNLVHTSLSEKYEQEFKFDIRVFETETEMLNVFLECINKYFHCLIGWNVVGYDWVYIKNRCKKLGIDIRKASPVSMKVNRSFKNKRKETFSVEMPQHRLILDYMMMFQGSLVYSNLESYSLNNISELILGLNKVQYEGNLRKLYDEEYLKFVAYAIVDTILVMLIHKKTNLMDVDFYEAYMNRIPFSKVGQNNISDSLVYNDLKENNIFLLESEYSNVEPQSFPGGYVKPPTKKKAKATMGLDFSSLYPNSIITNGLSPEKYIDSVEMDPNNLGKVSEKDLQKWLKYKNMGFSLTPVGNIYDTREEGLYVRIEKKLIGKRKVFKNYASDIYLGILTKIEDAITKKEQNNN